MPSEIRMITFSTGELIEAVHRSRKILNPPLPTGMIESCRTEDKDGVFLSMTIRNKSDGSVHEVNLNPETVAAVLLQYCFFRRIPIPRAAAKSVQTASGNVTLVLKTGQKAELEPAAAEPEKEPAEPEKEATESEKKAAEPKKKAAEPEKK
jgi:hypothetical protein